MFEDNIDWDIVTQNSDNSMTVRDPNFFIPTGTRNCRANHLKWNEIDRPQTITFCRSIDRTNRIADLLTAMGMAESCSFKRNATS